MKNVGIHVLDFNDNIIDFISQSDGALINAEMSMNVEEKTETFDFTIENTRAEKLRERNRIIAQDNNGTFREFIIIHIIDNFDGTTEIECNASYLEDLKTAKPIKPGKFEAHTTTQALLKTLADTGWEVSDDTEYGGNRTTSWTSHTNPFDLIYMLCTTYDMVPSFYIELGAHTVEHRYVSITKPKNLFKGKEITKGKDLTGMTRTIDLSEVKTALLAVGPEKEDGSRIETVVVDDEAQEIFGLPNRYIWDVYEPESNDENMTLKRLTTLAKTELNKRNQAAISYEVSSIDIHKYYNDVTVHLRDIVRVKDRDFRPPLYIEAEVIGIKYNWLADESEFTFGNVIEYEETKLREFFNRKLDEITKKLNDSISNVNTIVSDVVAGELEYYERKIFKGSEPPENPQNDTLWYDTSNPDVAVLRRYWNGEWITQTADDVEKIGGLRREQVMYRDLNNSFINLTIQHSKLQNDVYDVLNSEYLVDDDLKGNLNLALLDVDAVYQEIKTNLDSMDEDTATIGKLIDTQTLFTMYRQKLQTLYKYVTDAKISIDKRLKLLQSQYTDEKFNDAMDKIAQSLPNGHWDSENQQLYADIPNRNEVENIKSTLQEYTDGKINDLNSILDKEIDSKINTTKSEISASISSVERKIDGIEVGGRNLLPSYNEKYLGQIYEKVTNTHNFTLSEWAKSIYRDDFIHSKLTPGETYTLTFDTEIIELSNKPSYVLNVGLILYDRNTLKTLVNAYEKIERVVGNKNHKSVTFTFEEGNYGILAYTNLSSQNGTSDGKPYESDTVRFTNLKLEKGNVATDWTPAPEDLQRQIQQAQKDAEEAAKVYAKAQDELKQIEAKAYADGIVDDEEKRAIADAIAKRDEAKRYAEQKAQEAQVAANQNTQEVIKPITTRVTSTESDVKVLKGQIGLMAKSDDVTQQLKNVDGRLTPLETTVKSNKATLDLLPDQINSKVSKQDYTLDKDEIVTRLNNAESERKQLNNQISDKVSLSEYESGINSVKSTNRNYLQSYYSPHQNIVNGVTNGAYSVTLNANRTLNFYFYDRGNGTNPTLEENTDYILKIHESDQNVRMGVFYNKGSNTIVGYTTDNVIRFNTKTYQDIRIVLIPNVDNHFIGKASLYKGTKELDWSPAPEDIELLGLTAENNAKSYINDYKNENETKLKLMNTEIAQNGEEIQARVSKQEFNASRKTLSQVISEISATTKGINLSYDENGNIQSYTMDRNGIQLRGDKVDITVNKDFNVVANRVNDKVGKDEIINRLNLSPEGLDIDVNKVGIRGGDSTNYIYLSQDKIEMAGTFQRTFRGNTQKDNVFMRAQGGFLRFRNNNQNRSLYYSDFGISTYIDGDSSEASGTLQFFDYTYSPTNSVRGVTLNSAGGAIALNSERNRIVLDANATVNIESETSSVYIRPMKNNRAGTNEFRFWTKLNDSVADTDGVLSYGTITELVEKAPASYSFGSGIRFDKSPKSRYIYATDKDGNIGTGDFYARNLLGDWWAKNNNLYALVDPKEGKLRITDYNGYNNGSPKYKDLQCDDIQANSVRVNTGQNFYIGVSTNELWVTNNLRYNGGNTGFKPVRASDFIKASSAEFKHDIKKWDYDALNVISNELQLYSYKYNDDEKQTIHHGPVIGDGYDIPVEFVFNSGVNTNEMLSWALRAIQQLNEKINKLEEQLNEQSITS
ncbi:phage tail spike protein [Staphylococcus haemolyticus]|uniref:phage tail spike protein n=1 Tax=Staphylococcus haemolyticus TaxID=1283 RepID=UPI0027E6904C|nr:phage tail spike protein [Staphylococcus haemolyticus]MDQ7225546.1 phage tail spike protein [Staphylococcus haemolyticus]